MHELTQEQRDAEEALKEALDGVDRANEIEGFRSSHIIVTGHVTYTDDGCPVESLTWNTPDGQSWATTVGMANCFLYRLKHLYLKEDTE